MTTQVSPEGRNAITADVLVTVDNRFTLYVNGQRLGSSQKGWQTPERFDGIPLQPTNNIFSFLASNFAADVVGGPSSAGLIAAIQITYSDGSVVVLPSIGSDKSWQTSDDVSAVAQTVVDPSKWRAATDIGKYGISPWFQVVL
jgi:hypothetical protein